jgi:Holliday junction resolvasome RuvABC endonuclease subunit
MEKERLSVDPGLTGTGLAFWRDRDWKKQVPPVHVQNLTVGYKGEWYERASRLSGEFHAVVAPRKIVRVYIEWPIFFQGSVKGHSATVKGDIYKLCYLIGCYGEVCASLDIPLELVNVGVWNGQLSKEVVWEWVKRRIPDVVKLNPESHSRDAIGIGLYKKGFF